MPLTDLTAVRNLVNSSVFAGWENFRRVHIIFLHARNFPTFLDFYMENYVHGTVNIFQTTHKANLRLHSVINTSDACFPSLLHPELIVFKISSLRWIAAIPPTLHHTYITCRNKNTLKRAAPKNTFSMRTIRKTLYAQ